MTDNNVVNLPLKKADEKLFACLICHEHWHGHDPKCPKCTSLSVIEDQIHLAPRTHVVYTCRCNDNQYFKIVKHPRHGTYFKCVICGMKHQPSLIGLETIEG